MKAGPRYRVKPRRHRTGITDYRKRLNLLKSKKTRIVVRKSLRNIQVQFVEYHQDGDRILTSVTTQELIKKFNWNFSTASTSAAYAIGLLAGKKAKDLGITEGIVDIGRYRPTVGSKLFAVVKGVVDAGIQCPHNESMLPSEERILGKHLNKDIQPLITKIKTSTTSGGK